MSAWGNKDFIASPHTINLSGLTVSNGTSKGTFFSNNYAAGDVIGFGTDQRYGTAVISAIASDTSMTLVSNTELTVGALTNEAYYVNERPAYVVDSDSLTTGNSVYGVSTTEIAGVTGGIGTITVATAGEGYTVIPTIAIAGGSGTGATATATAKVVTIQVANAGAGFTNGDIIQIGGGTGTSANASVTVTSDGIGTVTALTIVNAGNYSALPGKVNNIPSNFLGRGLRANLEFGLSAVTVTAAGSGYTSPTITVANTGGNVISIATATATLNSSIAEGGDYHRVAHAGWVKFGDQYTDADGNTRQKTEVLVAMSSITGDNDIDDTGDVQLPD
jgi:hypothetical protein